MSVISQHLRIINKGNPTLLFIFLFLLGTLFSCYKEVDITPDMPNELLFINGKEVFFDNDQMMALYPIPAYGTLVGTITCNNDYSFKMDGAEIADGTDYRFEIPDKDKAYLLSITSAEGETKVYNLKFTTLPLIQLTDQYSSVPKEDYIPAILKLNDPNRDSEQTEYITIKVHGDTSSRRKKKSYGFNIQTDDHYHQTKSTSLLGMYHYPSWILDAAYVDKSMVRNRISFDLWNEIQKENPSGERNTLFSATQGYFVEVIENGKYAGVYCLCENINETLLNEDNNLTSDNGIRCLYKSGGWSSGTRLTNYSDTSSHSATWGMWQQKYPSPDSMTLWKPLYDYVKFVSDASDQSFSSNIGQYMVLDQASDLYIFLNLLMASDNLGKNLFMTQKKSENAFYVCPWDLDATWGRDWDGKKTNTGEIISFNLYDRLLEINPDHFNAKLSARWFSLRLSILTGENFSKLFNHYETQLTVSGAAEREKERWPNSFNDLETEDKYITQWINQRIAVLDNYFATLKLAP